MMLEMSRDYSWRRHAKKAETLLTIAIKNPAEAKKDSLDLMYQAVVEITQAINALETTPVERKAKG